MHIRRRSEISPGSNDDFNIQSTPGTNSQGDIAFNVDGIINQE